VKVRVVRWSAQIVVAGVVVSCPPRAWCQGESAADPPITASQRVEWVVDGTLGLRSVTVFGPAAAGFQTGLNTPPEWTRSWFGFGRRYLERGVDVAMSSSIEAGLGAMSGEDPRYARLGHGRMRARAFYAVRTTFVARHGDGTWHPAWARYVANVANTMIENAWLPPSETTAGQTARRSIAGIVSRIGANALTEFWPDIAKRLHLSDSHAVTSRFD